MSEKYPDNPVESMPYGFKEFVSSAMEPSLAVAIKDANEMWSEEYREDMTYSEIKGLISDLDQAYGGEFLQKPFLVTGLALIVDRERGQNILMADPEYDKESFLDKTNCFWGGFGALVQDDGKHSLRLLISSPYTDSGEEKLLYLAAQSSSILESNDHDSFSIEHLSASLDRHIPNFMASLDEIIFESQGSLDYIVKALVDIDDMELEFL